MTTPAAADPAARMPRQIPFIIASEACERFSFYGMRNIMTMFLTTMLLVHSVPDELARKDTAKEVFHSFVIGTYFFPLLGGYLADRFFGKYRTILWFSLIYCVGLAILATFAHSIRGFYLGLFLISFGAGGIKPLVASFMGDQFDSRTKHLAKLAFDAFYWIINFGSFFGSLLMAPILVLFGPRWAFGVPCVLMLVATLVLWLARRRYVMVPVAADNPDSFMRVSMTALFSPGASRVGSVIALGGGVLALGSLALYFAGLGWVTVICLAAVMLITGFGIGTSLQLERARGKHPDEAIDGVRSVLRILIVFALCTPFFSLFDQKASTWVLQGGYMHSPSWDFDLGSWGIWELAFIPSQMQALNPAMVMILIPFNNLVLYPWLRRIGWEPTSLRKMTVGIGFAAVSWIVAGGIQLAIDDGGEKISIMWQIAPYALLTFGEVLVSATGLEFAYSQAPLAMKGVIMSFWYLANTVGNLWVLLANTGLGTEWMTSRIAGTGLSHDAFIIFFFAAFAFLIMIVFQLYARRYKMVDRYRTGPAGAKPAPLPEARVRDDKK